jgi:DNA polymerase-3 subunit delta'
MWNNIIGQEKVKLFLKNSIKNKRLNSAYLFYGKKGVGKDAVAIELAKSLNCTNLHNNYDACDNCKSCLDIQKFQSRYVKFITALPASKQDNQDDNILLTLSSDDYEIYLSELEKKSHNLYHRINLPKANSIRIDSIRQLIKEAYITATENKKKVFIISDCDLMNQNTANSILKILEEPPQNTIIILTTSRINSLLPTITGRCQKIVFESLNKNELQFYLKNHFLELDNRELELFSEIAQGSLGIFQDFELDSFNKFRQNIVDILRNLVSQKYIGMSKLISEITELKDKNIAKLTLFILMLWFKDVNQAKIKNYQNIINKDLTENIKIFANKYDANIFRIILILEDTVRDIDSNVNLELLFQNLVYKIKSYL